MQSLTIGALVRGIRNVKAVFLAWQDPTTRIWYPVGRLTFEGSSYEFVYTHGAIDAQKQSNFRPLDSFPDFYSVYSSESLFPLFSNRVLPPARPDYGQFAEWLNVPLDRDDPIALLARSGGRRATDTLEVLPCPEPDHEGMYRIHFFAHGLRYLPDCAVERVDQLKPGQQLLMSHDFQNPHDPHALMLRTHDDFPRDRFIVGYCPRYLLEDAFRLLQSCSPQVTVERVNPAPAPLQFRLLCNMTACWPEGFRPFSTGPYVPLVAIASV